ncbi:MAG: preprotein translocase subunit SecG [Cyanobacteriota bacterium]|jgi:preprotein translocase subunit SecG|nr:preprotein translocase subunit SecG [Pleurocapsa minor HA4230-MV1]
MNLYQIVQIIWAACGFLIIVFILLHSPKGDGLGGIGGQSQMFTSTKSAENALNRITWGLGIGFITLTVMLSAGWIG